VLRYNVPGAERGPVETMTRTYQPSNSPPDFADSP
jgi:hypothetical protein